MFDADGWFDDELVRREKVLAGGTVVANRKRDKRLVAWAKAEGLAVYIGRGTQYGNPYVMGKDGTRDEVCDRYELEVLPLLGPLGKLRGKVLTCWCYPARCHGDAIIGALEWGVQ